MGLVSGAAVVKQGLQGLASWLQSLWGLQMLMEFQSRGTTGGSGHFDPAQGLARPWIWLRKTTKPGGCMMVARACLRRFCS